MTEKISANLGKINKTIISLGAEMQSVFCIYNSGNLLISKNFGDTSNLDNFNLYKKELEDYINKNNLKPDIILADMHPIYNTSLYAEELSKKSGAALIKVQHHLAHAYSVAVEHNLTTFSSIICDGLGYGTDGTIWGGEIFHQNQRIGHLEQHKQLGGDSATQHPAKMLISILSKFQDEKEILENLRGYFTQHQLKILLKQLNQNYNCPLTTSCGRILDAASFLLGFATERTYDGSPAIELDKNASIPYEITQVIENDILKTVPLFQYLIENKTKDKKRLAATVISYIAEGLYKIASKPKLPIVFSGGCAHSKLFSGILANKGIFLNKEISCGDAGISFGQLACYLTNSRNNVA